MSGCIEPCPYFCPQPIFCSSTELGMWGPVQTLSPSAPPPQVVCAVFCSSEGSLALEEGGYLDITGPGQQLKVLEDAGYLDLTGPGLEKLPPPRHGNGPYLKTLMSRAADCSPFVWGRSWYGSRLKALASSTRETCWHVSKHNLGVCEVLASRQTAHCSGFCVCF